MIFKSFILIVFLAAPYFVCGAESSLKNDIGKKRLLLADSKNSVKGSQQGTAKAASQSPVEGTQENIPESVFELNKKEPQAIGLILAFKHWPLKAGEKKLIRKKTKKAGLKKKSELERFKTWVFEWPKWRKGLEAEKLCEDFSTLAFLDYCEPDYLLEPGGFIKSGAHDTLTKEEGPPVPKKDGRKYK